MKTSDLSMISGRDGRGAGSAASYRFQSGSPMIREYDIAALEDNQDNHFHRMKGNEWDEFVGSIQSFGVVSPLLIRPIPDSPGRYEILAGHNRRCAAAEAGLKTVPCIVVDVDDVDASILIGITNQQRGEVSDLEWGWTYRTTLEMVKAQRVNARKTTASKKTPDTGGTGDLSSGNARADRSIDLVAHKYGVDRKTVRRKIRLTYLVPQLYDLGQRLRYSQKMMVSMSYLPPAVQINIVQAAVIENIPVNERTVAALREEASARDLTIGQVLRICREQAEADDPAGPAAAGFGSPNLRQVRCQVPEALFPDRLPKGSRQAYVTAALEYIRDRHIDLPL